MKQIRLFLSWLVVCVCLAGIAAQARAKCPRRPLNTNKATKIARKWWGIALKHYNAKAYTRAIEAWKCSYKMFSHPLGLYNIAMAAEKAGKFKMALEYYWRYLPTVGDPQHQRKIRAKIALMENRSRSSKAHKPRPIAPRVAPRPRAAVVTRPTPPEPVRPTPPEPERPPSPTPPGTAPGRPAGPAAPPRPDKGATIPTPERKPAKKKIGLMGILGWTSVGLGAALTITGLALGGMADQAKRTVTDAKEGTNWKDKLKKPYENYKKYLAGSLVSAGVGVAALAAGTVLIILDKRSRTGKERERISAVPVALPHGGMLSIEGRF